MSFYRKKWYQRAKKKTDEKVEIEEQDCEIIFEGECENLIRGVSIDPGINTFTLCFEEFSRDKIKKDPSNILSHGKVIKFLQHSFKPVTISELKAQVYLYLSSIRKTFDFSDFIVIEQQLDKNPMCQVIEHHVHAFIISQYLTNKIIASYPASRKTQRLNAPKSLKGNKTARKKWATHKAIEILQLRKDKETLKFLMKHDKLDDFCDAFCMMQAFKIDVFINRKL